MAVIRSMQFMNHGEAIFSDFCWHGNGRNRRNRVLPDLRQYLGDVRIMASEETQLQCNTTHNHDSI